MERVWKKRKRELETEPWENRSIQEAAAGKEQNRTKEGSTLKADRTVAELPYQD